MQKNAGIGCNIDKIMTKQQHRTQAQKFDAAPFPSLLFTPCTLYCEL